MITETDSHAKLAIGDRNLAPVVALVDGLLTTSLPAGITAATGMDVLTHAIEAYVCTLASPINDLLALKSIRLVAGHLIRAVTNKRYQPAREAMMLASTLERGAINNRTSPVCIVYLKEWEADMMHRMDCGMQSFCHISCLSGREVVIERFTCIAEAFGAYPRPEEAVAQVTELNRSLKFPSLKDLGVKSSDLPELAALAEANVSNPSNPIPMKAPDYLGILERAMKGALEDGWMKSGLFRFELSWY